MEIKDILKNRRLELGLTMKQIADAVGVSEGTVSRWESGKIADMRRDKIVAYAKALKLSPSIIMGWDEPVKDESTGKRYYFDDTTAAKAQELFENSDMRILFDAAQGSTPEDLQMAADLLKRLKGNTDG